MPASPHSVRQLEVMVASPGDVKAFRNAVAAELQQWNTTRSRDTRISLLPTLWETGSVPVSGQGDGQSVINAQMVEGAHILIAVFHSRLGTPTARAISGTAEEIDQAIEDGKQVHVYFCEKDLPYRVDTEQLEALRAFRKEVEQRSLVGTFKTAVELRREIVKAIELDIANMPDPATQSASGSIKAVRTAMRARPPRKITTGASVVSARKISRGSAANRKNDDSRYVDMFEQALKDDPKA